VAVEGDEAISGGEAAEAHVLRDLYDSNLLLGNFLDGAALNPRVVLAEFKIER
jgi:hypothetical protein